MTEAFNQVLYKMIYYSTLVEFEEETKKSWTSLVHHVSLQHVLIPESTTAPLSIDTNSSLSNRNSNSINAILIEGPNALTDDLNNSVRHITR